MTTSGAYLTPNQNRSNLHIVSKAMVTLIVTNGMTATGVRFVRRGLQYTVSASREVILSAGLHSFVPNFNNISNQ